MREARASYESEPSRCARTGSRVGSGRGRTARRLGRRTSSSRSCVRWASPPGDLLLDLGCGHGQYARQISETTGARVLAIDVSSDSVRETDAAARLAGAGRVAVGRAAAEALPLRDGGVRFIWCRDMLNHVDLSATMRECAAVLACGGYMVVYQTFATELLEPLEARRIFVAFENRRPKHGRELLRARARKRPGSRFSSGTRSEASGASGGKRTARGRHRRA